MIAVDTNILVYAHRPDAPFHDSARRIMTELAEGRASWAIPWPCLHEFFAVVTHPRVFAPSTAIAGALEQIEAWMESPSLSLLRENGDHWEALKACITAGKVIGPMIHDARIAAICLSHGVHELWTADRDFSRFKDLSTRNPLV